MASEKARAGRPAGRRCGAHRKRFKHYLIQAVFKESSKCDNMCADVYLRGQLCGEAVRLAKEPVEISRSTVLWHVPRKFGDVFLRNEVLVFSLLIWFSMSRLRTLTEHFRSFPSVI
jgi:hypothetical protein